MVAGLGRMAGAQISRPWCATSTWRARQRLSRARPGARLLRVRALITGPLRVVEDQCERRGLELLRGAAEVRECASGRQVQRTPTIDVSRLTDEELEVLESALRQSICGSPPKSR